MNVGVTRETREGERRVALTPDAAGRLVKTGAAVLIERGAGAGAFFPDEAYEAAGATLTDAEGVHRDADVVLKVNRPGDSELGRLRPGSALIATLQPFTSLEAVRRLAAASVTAFAMDLIPRITRAQPMDSLSSQSNIAGYKAVLVAADRLAKFFPMLTTAAGTVTPARVFVMGAGVAGLQAIATARRLGATVEAFDTRPIVKEQVESLGARFVQVDLGTEKTEGAGGYAAALGEETLRRQQELLAERIKASDVVITTALVPGRRAPVLITEAMARAMRPGSVIVDLAAEMGGNCELTEPGRTVEKHGVTIVGEVNHPSGVAVHASQLYARNITTLLAHLTKDGSLALDLNDEITKGALVTHEGRIVNDAVRAAAEKPA
jgi:NAD(P) transhydrogenase subunit alpha